MVILLNGSFRGESSNSNYFLGLVEKALHLPCERKNLCQITDMDKFGEELAQADAIVLGMPLYVDGVPAQVMELFEHLYNKGAGSLGNKHVYVVTNLGFYEGEQAHVLLRIVKNWCQRMGLTYGGGLAIGAGEMLGGFLREVPVDNGPNKMLGEGVRDLAAHIEQGTEMEERIIKPSGFPRRMYMMAANSSWTPQAKKNGVAKKDIRQKM